ncbi:MAG TPA: alpha/beta fold hydrolase [Tepidisphaeraceae bacterium]|jgi:dienelactone hydrolase|nr:alpha/beta fold hydrolase [Tepidisphaeraceae bacterium]
MKARSLLLTAVLLFVFGAAPATQPDAGNGWDPSVYSYHRPAHLVVEQTTPTEEQVSFFRRPTQMPADAPAPKETGPADPKVVGSADVIRLLFTDADGQVVPVLLCTPKRKSGAFPLVIATHGLTSNKAQVCGQVAAALIAKGFAVMAADMPEHGERPGDPIKQNPLVIFKLFQESVIDVRQEIDLAEQLPQITTKGGVVLLGYSMGSWISAQAAPADPRVRAVVLMVGGIEPENFPIEKGPNGAERDPSKSLQHFAGKPVLMLNGTKDPLVPPETSMALFNALPEPKQQYWYAGGHLLPRRAYKDAADWIAKLSPPAEQ